MAFVPRAAEIKLLFWRFVLTHPLEGQGAPVRMETTWYGCDSAPTKVSVGGPWQTVTGRPAYPPLRLDLLATKDVCFGGGGLV